MDRKAQFFEAIKKEMTVTLATSASDSVTMRPVSPVYYEGAILIFTEKDSLKYKQLAVNPNCCVATGLFFAQAKAELLGSTMLDENKALREAYSAKFPGAFDENIAFGGRNADFVLLKPFMLTGWGFENDAPTADGIPNAPFVMAI